MFLVGSKTKKQLLFSKVATIIEIVLLIGLMILILAFPKLIKTVYPSFQCGISENGEC